MALGGVLAGSGMDVLGKLVMAEASAAQGVLLRWGFGLLLLLCLFRLRRQRPRMARRDVHLIRALLNLLGSYCFFHALATLPLSLVVTIFYAEPLLALPFARLLLRERVGARRLAALAAGFLGILLATRPSFAGAGGDLLVALLGAGAWALLHVLTKARGGRESVPDLMFWLALFSTAASLPLALADWRPLATETLLGALGVAAFGMANSLLFLSALKRADALLVIGIGYLALPLGFLASWLFFGEALQPLTLAGGALVLLAVWGLAAVPARRAAG